MKVLLFGIAREIVGEQKLLIKEGENITTVGQLKTRLTEIYPDFKSLSNIAVAVDNEYAEDETRIESTNEVAIIPPVSGG